MDNITIEIPGHGGLRGERCGVTAHRFLGVPYALPPVESRRWQRPEPLPLDYQYGHGDHEALDCTQYQGLCPQPDYIMNGTNMSAVEGVRHSEDCLTLNIWLPAAAPPSGTHWPVYVWLHGGWLQMGNPCMTDKTNPWELVDAAGVNLQAIVVAVGYRLNIFGFLAGEGLSGNFGFWDQRCALQWVQDHISQFGGDPTRVTLGGLSAGAYSTNAQLQYELRHGSKENPLFKNVFMVSNAIPVQPKSIEEAESQLHDVLETFRIDPTLTRDQQIEALRKVSADDLVLSFPSLRVDTFRAVTDNDFILDDMIQTLRDGKVARAFKERGMRIVIGEAEAEQHMYAAINPPSSLKEMQTALENYYPAKICKKLIPRYLPDGHSMTDKDAARIFGAITSDVQVRGPIRAFSKTLVDAGLPLSDIFRYRSGFRAKCLDKYCAPELGVTHGYDMYTWWATLRLGFDDNEIAITKDWLSRSLIPLVHGKPFKSKCTKIEQYTKFEPNGRIHVMDDEYWNGLLELDGICTATPL